MESLRELSLSAVMKYGYWHHFRVPHRLLLELQTVNDFIESKMCGHGYFDFQKIESPRFGVSWQNGSWIFTLFGGPFKRETIMTENINHLGRFMSSDWSDIFGLSCTEAFLHGFWINSYKLRLEKKTVSFTGSLLDKNGNMLKFRADFLFNPHNFDLLVRTVGWYPFQPIIRFHCQREFVQTSEEVRMTLIYDEIEENTVRFQPD